eukprot:1705536-Amphidinium_carterae.3
MASTSHTTSTWTMVSTRGTILHCLRQYSLERWRKSEVSLQADIPRQLRQPLQPTKKEQEEHRLTHMPYKSWTHGVQSV